MRFFKPIVLAIFTVTALASCDHKVSMITDVHADGSLEKIIVQESKNNSSHPHSNILGVDSVKGWNVKVEPIDTSAGKEGDSDIEYRITLRKRFASAAEANAELATPNDTLFRVTSTFEKKFRWFYTYLYYADTYQAINRMKHPIADYLTKEDYDFIDRLPAEGKPIARADSLYLSELERKLFDIYGARAFFEMYYVTAEELLRKNNVAPVWLDTLRKHKDDLFNRVRGKDVDEDFMVEAMEGLGIPLPDDADDQFTMLIKPDERITAFMSMADGGEYQHAINMPWDVIRSNADSVSRRTLFWSPPSIKFLVKDYTMYAEARQMNYLAVALSVMAISFTLYLILRRLGPARRGL